jgi:hypothetical protein
MQKQLWKTQGMARKRDYDDDEIILEIARLIWRKGISIADLYTVLGFDLDNYNCDPETTIATISGIITGWNNNPEDSQSS